MKGSHSWFKALFGVDELKYKQVQESFRLSTNHDVLTSVVNNRKFNIGNFSTPRLEHLRNEALGLLRQSAINEPVVLDKPKIYKHIAAGDAFLMHYRHPNSVFQAASQFNCLEFTSSKTVPEYGVENYQYDGTQGPACALACAAGTVYRNYFVPCNPQNKSVLGQTKHCQINNLDELESFLDNTANDYWYVENGYTFSRDSHHLELLNQRIHTSFNTPSLRLQLLNKIKIGLHRDVGVTFKSRYEPVSEHETEVTVTQVYGSALSCRYSGIDNQYWEPLARIVLDSVYESTLWAAVIHFNSHTNAQSTTLQKVAEGNDDSTSTAAETVLTAPAKDTSVSDTTAEPVQTMKSEQGNDVFLTFLGGGVFGNENIWIAQAIGRALAILTHHNADLTVNICHYRQIGERMQNDIDEAYESCLAELRNGGVV